MKAGIIGLPTTGKTTLFNALTRGEAPVMGLKGRRQEANVGVIPVPDSRFEYLVSVYRPKKVSPASIEVIDGAAPIGVEQRKDKFGSDFFTGIRSVDALIHVVRTFDDPSVCPPEGGLDPLRDIRRVNDELVLADLSLLETRLERIRKSLQSKRVTPGSPQMMESELLQRVLDHLEASRPPRELEFSADESRLIKGYDLLTLKPMIVVANVSESGADDDLLRPLREYCSTGGLELIEMSARIEAEIAQMPQNEEQEYLAAMGISEPARNKVVRSAYRALGLISFFTVGEDEVKAWTIRRGATAVHAAGAIHSDLARGFIRAEVVGYDDFRRPGSWDAAKAEGLVRLEGKEYVVNDGDILVVRFKV